MVQRLESLEEENELLQARLASLQRLGKVGRGARNAVVDDAAVRSVRQVIPPSSDWSTPSLAYGASPYGGYGYRFPAAALLDDLVVPSVSPRALSPRPAMMAAMSPRGSLAGGCVSLRSPRSPLQSPRTVWTAAALSRSPSPLPLPRSVLSAADAAAAVTAAVASGAGSPPVPAPPPFAALPGSGCARFSFTPGALPAAPPPPLAPRLSLSPSSSRGCLVPPTDAPSAAVSFVAPLGVAGALSAARATASTASPRGLEGSVQVPAGARSPVPPAGTFWASVPASAAAGSITWYDISARGSTAITGRSGDVSAAGACATAEAGAPSANGSPSARSEATLAPPGTAAAAAEAVASARPSHRQGQQRSSSGRYGPDGLLELCSCTRGGSTFRPSGRVSKKPPAHGGDGASDGSGSEDGEALSRNGDPFLCYLR
eukprot:TRINITY_DN68_c2_g3_i1.p1 TRINITY_DN68_c2_g3~~TRINITY_DN68_c2_g3_i1.p1  ORF type:complete len:491 (+),score=89.94 TRINITY_DN68_c2_g3_i1:186-1475(+)